MVTVWARHLAAGLEKDVDFEGLTAYEEGQKKRSRAKVLVFVDNSEVDYVELAKETFRQICGEAAKLTESTALAESTPT